MYYLLWIVYRLYKLKYMEKIAAILLNFKNEVNHLNNDFVNACLMFYKQLQYTDSNTVDTILNYEANKIITSKLYYLSKLNGNIILFRLISM